MGETLTVEKSGYVARLTLTKPAMGPEFFDELAAALPPVAADGDVRAVVVGAAGKAFSYGLDLMGTFQKHGHLFTAGGLAGPRAELLALLRRWQEAFTALARLPVPVIAAVHGWCVGGGLDLASACDIRLASRDARFSLRETRLAIVADLGSLQRLPGIVGQARTRELAFTGRDFDAAEALRIGLVTELFDDREKLAEGAMTLAEQIAKNPPLTVRGVKAVLGFGEGKPAGEGLDYVAVWNAAFLSSEDLVEAAASFMEKRPPSFKGR